MIFWQLAPIFIFFCFCVPQTMGKPNPDIECKTKCKPPPSSNAKNVNGAFHIQFSEDECRATYACSGSATTVYLGDQTDIVDTDHNFTCKDGLFQHRHQLCADDCPMENVTKVQCESDVVNPRKEAAKAHARCAAHCKLPTSSEAEGAYGGFYVQVNEDSCEAYYSCNGAATRVTFKDGKVAMHDSFSTFQCNNKTGIVEYTNKNCGKSSCPPREIVAARCEKNFNITCDGGNVKRRDPSCGDACPTEEMMKEQCEKEAASKALAACEAKCKLPPANEGNFDVQANGDGCEATFGCSRAAVRVTFKNGKEETLENHVTFSCNNKTGIVEYAEKDCVKTPCDAREIVKAHCEKNDE